MPDYSSLASVAGRILDALDIDCEAATLALLLGLENEDAAGLERALIGRGVAVSTPEGRLRAGCASRNVPQDRKPRSARPALRNEGGRPGGADGPLPDGGVFIPGTLPDALRHYERGRFPEFLAAGLACLRSFVRGDFVVAARCAYAVLAHELRKARLPLRERELCAQCVAIGLELQQEMLHFPWRVRDAATVYYKLRAVAFVLGDTRSLGLLDLAIGSLNINVRSLRKSRFYHQVMLRGVNTVNGLGDSDILLHSSGMICFYYFVEGKFTKSINCAYSAMYMPEQSNFNFERMLYSYAALSAVYLGEYDVAVNMLHLAINRAKNREQWLDVGSLRAILAYACLLQGNHDEAFALIDDILGMKRLAVRTYADVMASRALAYHHYMRGNLRGSYVCFKNWLDNAGDKGLIHSNYIAVPFVLELLAAYQLAGFPPLGERPLDQELELCLASPSCLLRGVALRVLAELRARRRGWGDEQALDRALESLAVFRACSASVEIAKTQQLLARLYQARGDGERAGAAAAEAWTIHRHYGQPPWPDDMDDLRAGQAAVRPEGKPAAALCVNLLQAVRQQCAWETNEAFFHSLLYALLATFGAEGGCVFRMEKDEARLVADVGGMAGGAGGWEDEGLAVREELARQAAAAGRTLWRPLNGDAAMKEGGPMALAVAADAEEQGLYLICLEGRLRAGVARALGEELFVVLENYLATEISIHLRRSAAWEDRMRSAASLAGHGGNLSEAGPILFRTRCMRDLLLQVDRVAAKDATVLILGESGVGKELIARRLHAMSGRHGEFVGVNLAGTPDELFESEFCGHEKGSFTGASYQKRGLFELADKGTLFIDEVGDIPPRLQVKLLRVLQEKRFLRVGGTRVLASDFRLIAATNRNLEEEVRAGRFREDLYYRLSVVPLHVPPLRERPEDVLFLADYFLRFFADRHQIPRRPFSEAERAAMLAYAWPGNVRELKNYVERCTLLPERTRPLPPEGPAAPAPLEPVAPAAHGAGTDDPARKLFAGLPTLEELQDRYFEYVYRRSEGMVGGRRGVATKLGISRTTAYAWMDRLKLRERYARRLVEKT